MHSSFGTGTSNLTTMN